jgi:glycoprotein endo-alpha-1,2-mannosidase
MKKNATAKRSQSALLKSDVSKEVLAFYYGWYGNPKVSKRWVHWTNVDMAAKRIGQSTHYPALGPYDSHDPAVVETHCRQAKESGLTGFIVSWWAKGDFHDEGMPLMLERANKHGIKATVYYETVPEGSHRVKRAIDDLTYIIDQYGHHPAWLKVGNHPVIFVYKRTLRHLKLDGWEKVMNVVRAKSPDGAVFIGDRISLEAACIFDGIHTYNPTRLTKGKSRGELRDWAKRKFLKLVQTAGPERIACITIIPGYDDLVLATRNPPRPTTDRHDGDTYRILWEEAIAANPDWVLVTSWNEWHEGSEIEPSAELGERELRTTRQFARKFRSLKLRRATRQLAYAPGTSQSHQLN